MLLRVTYTTGIPRTVLGKPECMVNLPTMFCYSEPTHLPSPTFSSQGSDASKTQNRATSSQTHHAPKAFLSFVWMPWSNPLFPLAYFKQKQHTDSNLNQFANDTMTGLCLDKLAICLIGTFDSKVSIWQNRNYR